MYLVYDIGGTNLRIGYSVDGKDFVASKSVPTPQDYQAGLKTITDLGKELSGGKVLKAAIGIAGMVNPAHNRLMQLAHLPEWSGQPLADDFASAFGLIPLIRNDAEMAAIGEAEMGAGQDYTSLLYFTIGTGVGAAWIQREPILTAVSLEPGHEVVQADGPPCPGCGQAGHLEAFISGSGLISQFHRPVPEINDPTVWETAARYTALGIYNSLQNHPAEAVILGGGMILHERIRIDQIEQELDKLLGGSAMPVIRKAVLGDQAGLYGALFLIK